MSKRQRAENDNTPSTIVHFLVDQTRFSVNRSTIERFPCSLLYKWIQSIDNCIDENTWFVDYGPKRFRRILEYMRTKTVPNRNKPRFQHFDYDCKYFQLFQAEPSITFREMECKEAIKVWLMDNKERAESGRYAYDIIIPESYLPSYWKECIIETCKPVSLEHDVYRAFKEYYNNDIQFEWETFSIALAQSEFCDEPFYNFPQQLCCEHLKNNMKLCIIVLFLVPKKLHCFGTEHRIPKKRAFFSNIGNEFPYEYCFHREYKCVDVVSQLETILKFFNNKLKLEQDPKTMKIVQKMITDCNEHYDTKYAKQFIKNHNKK